MSPAHHHQPEPDALLCASIDRSLRHPVMFFFTSGAAWLAVALVLGLFSSIKLHAPGFLADCPWLGFGRVRAAHLDALVYGWGCQVAFGVLIWLASRLSRQECRNAGTILVAGHLWNLGVGLGVLAVLGGFSTGLSWMEFPLFAWPVLLLSYAAIAVWVLVQFRSRGHGHVFLGLWYALGAVLWFPWIFASAHLLVHAPGGHPLMVAAVNAWYKSALLLLFFVPAGAAAAYYLVAKVTGRPVYAYRLGMVGFWGLALVAPLAGMQKLAGAPVPYFLSYLGAAAMVLVAAPLLTVAVNVLGTAHGHGEMIARSPTLRFTVAGTVGLLVLGLSGVVLSLPGSTLPLVQFSIAAYGFEVFALYGFFSMTMFGAVYFIVPRVTRREWLSRTMIRTHFWFSVYGSAALVAFGILGGLMHGAAQENWREPWDNAAAYVRPYAVGLTFTWALLAFANFFFLAHLAFMWLRLGRRSSHPTLLGRTGSEPHGPHGPEGDIDNLGQTASYAARHNVL